MKLERLGCGALWSDLCGWKKGAGKCVAGGSLAWCQRPQQSLVSGAEGVGLAQGLDLVVGSKNDGVDSWFEPQGEWLCYCGRWRKRLL